MPYERSRGKQCIVVGCSNNQRDIYQWKTSICELHDEKHELCICIAPFRFHCLPTNVNRRREWLKAVNRKDYSPKGQAMVRKMKTNCFLILILYKMIDSVKNESSYIQCCNRHICSEAILR